MRVVGREHIPRTGGVLIAANHTSYIDPVVLGVAAPRPLWFMAKSELFEIPFFTGLIRRLHAFSVRRGVVDRQALRRAHEILTGGEPLVVFFEGGRSNDGRLMQAEPGTALMALRAGVPIVPAAIIDADKFLPRGSKLLKFARVTLIFDEPLSFPHLEGRSSDRIAIAEVNAVLMERMAAMMREYGAPERVPEGYPHTVAEGAASE